MASSQQSKTGGRQKSESADRGLAAAPPTRAVPVVDHWHGTAVPDPYQWLEQGEDPETLAWVARQTERTDAILAARPETAALRARWLAEASVSGVRGLRRAGRYLFYERRAPGASQPTLYRRGVFDGLEEVAVDPAQQGGSELASLDWYQPSLDGRWLAYGLSTEGDEWSTLYARDLDASVDLDVAIPRARGSSVAWEPDGSGFYYTRYPEPGTMPPGEEFYNVRLFFHSMAGPGPDPEVFGSAIGRDDFPEVMLSDEGRYLLVSVHHGWHSAELWFADRERGTPLTRLAAEKDTHYAGLLAGHAYYVLTTLRAPRGRIMRVPLDTTVTWSDARQVVPERPDATLLDFAVSRGVLWLHYLVDAHSELVRWDLAAGEGQPVALPGLGTVSGVEASPTDERVYFVFESFVVKPGVYTVANGRAVPLVVPEQHGAAARVRQEWATSADGTRLPLFVIEPPGGLAAAGPTVLTGYGGFNAATTPAYSPDAAVWVSAGGRWASAVLRGGSEYGEAWHRAGMREHKQNVFDDFFAAAERLIEAGFTNSVHLGITGRSNGGLLMGAALTQRPELFQAVVVGVPLLDMLRYHHFLIARIWASEYGSADKPAEFAYLHRYSPYHRIKPGTAYPATFLWAAHKDSRVDPAHARKMTARLQAAQGGLAPVLYREEGQVGHGMGKPLSWQAASQGDQLGFLAWRLGLKVDPPA